MSVNYSLIKDLPNELKNIIFSYIPYSKLIFVNNNYYLAYHKYLPINPSYIENFIRDIIRKDNRFVFKMLLLENYIKWTKIKKYIYKNIICYDYVSFVNYYIIQNKSNKCKKELNDYISKYGIMNKKEFKKKNTIINKRWK
jgi:hypothetical protein